MNIHLGSKIRTVFIFFMAFGIDFVFAHSFPENQHFSKSLTVTMTNDPSNNGILVYDTSNHSLLQTLPTYGKGGVRGNARGLRQWNNQFLAVVNYGSQSVSIFKRITDKGGKSVLILQNVVHTSSAPVSVDFDNHHLYVAGDLSVDSFPVNKFGIGPKDGTANLVLVGGEVPQAGSTAQIGSIGKELLVTLKTDPIPGTVDVIGLRFDGSVSGLVESISAPQNTLTPFGFSTFEDGTALITLAHSGDIGLFRNHSFVKVINSGGQLGPCWTTRIGKYVMVVNTGSKTVSREISTGENIFIDAPVAASITTGGNPTDTDANGGYQVVLDLSSTSHLNFFKINAFGELIADGAPIELGLPSPNGVAVLAAP